MTTKNNQQHKPMIRSKKIADHLRVTEEKPSLIKQQSVLYEFISDSCNTNYICYTCRHLHQRVEEHKYSVIGKHLRDVHGLTPDNLIENLKGPVLTCELDRSRIDPGRKRAKCEHFKAIRDRSKVVHQERWSRIDPI